MVLSYIVGQKKNPIPYPMKDILAYVILAAICTAMMYTLDDLPIWAKLAYNTFFIIIFLIVVIRHDLPLSRIPVVGRYFKKSNK
jgi:hypothetical protein